MTCSASKELFYWLDINLELTSKNSWFFFLDSSYLSKLIAIHVSEQDNFHQNYIFSHTNVMTTNAIIMKSPSS